MIYGLSYPDVAVIAFFLVVMVVAGFRLSRRMTDSESMFIAHRGMGKLYQFFLTFGQSTSADGAIMVSREVYRQGASGIWINMMLLFLTPFHWFTSMWHRRLRLTTVSDYFTLRFRSRFLSMGLAGFLLISGTMGIGLSYILSYKMMKGLMPKPEIEYTVVEKQSAAEYRELKSLETRYKAGTLTDGEQGRFSLLQEKDKRGELHSYHSYLNKLLFYGFYGTVMVLYALLGGIIAATLADVFQSILMIVLSIIIMLPLALAKAGWFSGLHEKLPAAAFDILSGHSGEYTAFMISGWALTSIVGLLAVAQNVTVSNAAKTEMDARTGMMTGALGKRLMLIPWGLFGLLAVVLYGDTVSDPDLLWGVLSRDLLGPGLIGLMLVGFLAANVANKCAGAVVGAALFTNNLFRPLFPGLSEKGYLAVGRLAIVFMLLGGMGMALLFDSILNLFKMFVTFNIIFGAPMWISLFWRRITRAAVIFQVSVCFILIALLPNLVPKVDGLARHEAWLSEARTAEGKSVGLCFEKVIRDNPADPASPRKGAGEFFPQIALLQAVGVDFSTATKADIEGVRFYFNCLLPFLLLILVSLFTKPEPKEVLDRFYARKNTPIAADPESDAQAVEAAANNPDSWKERKIFPNSKWEMLKPTRIDVLGFCGGWVLVGLIIVLMWGALNIRVP